VQEVYMEKTEQTEISPFAVQGVLAALKEVQDTVRAYDTGADYRDAAGSGGSAFAGTEREAIMPPTRQ
jgi:hypothetical protein